MKRTFTLNYSPRVLAKVPLNILDFVQRFGSTKLVAAIIRGALILAVISALVLIAALPAQAQTETVLYSFAGGTDGAQPFQAGVVFDLSGNLYGVTQYGGTYNQGTIFKLAPSGGSWTETVLYSFTGGSDGAVPQGGLATDGMTTVFGTTAYGGTDNDSCGTLFLYYLGGSFQLLHTFDDMTKDGCQPESDVIYDGYYVYGTTAFGGGPAEPGTVFGWGPGGVYARWDCPAHNSWWPSGLSFVGKNATIYGTANFGTLQKGYLYGKVFELTYGGIKVKHSFSSKEKEGFRPIGNLAWQVNADGVLVMYGATQAGGCCGNGAIYQLADKEGDDKWSISLVHSFSGSDGYPWGGVVIDVAGNLYGTTITGGTGNSGTVFELTPGAKNEWTYTVLHNFTGGTDGSGPTGSLVFDSAGNLYGTTTAGGVYGQGVVYEVTPPAAVKK